MHSFLGPPKLRPRDARAQFGGCESGMEHAPNPTGRAGGKFGPVFFLPHPVLLVVQPSVRCQQCNRFSTARFPPECARSQVYKSVHPRSAVPLIQLSRSSVSTYPPLRRRHFSPISPFAAKHTPISHVTTAGPSTRTFSRRDRRGPQREGVLGESLGLLQVRRGGSAPYG